MMMNKQNKKENGNRQAQSLQNDIIQHRGPQIFGQHILSIKANYSSHFCQRNHIKISNRSQMNAKKHQNFGNFSQLFSENPTVGG